MAKKEISLLPHQGLEGTALGNLVNWVLSVGRYIVVFTELVVIGAFVSRFWLDRKNSDLSDKIRQQKAILESAQEFESEFRLFQTKLKVAAQSLEKKEPYTAPLNLIAENIPSGMSLVKYGFDADEESSSAELKGEISVLTLIFSENSLARFIDNLIRSEQVDSIRIGTIERAQGTTGMTIQFLISFHQAKE